jgi:type I restriction enzyme M protein
MSNSTLPNKETQRLAWKILETLRVDLQLISYLDVLPAITAITADPEFQELNMEKPMPEHLIQTLREKLKISQATLSLHDGLSDVLSSLLKYQHENPGNYSELFETLLQEIIESQGKSAGAHSQFTELTKLMIELGVTPTTSSVFNPFAGTASFGIHLPPDIGYYGQELNPEVHGIGKSRIQAHQLTHNRSLELEDSVSNWPRPSIQFDLIISNPPFGLKIAESPNTSKKKTLAEEFLISKSISNLTATGKAVFLLTPQILFGGLSLLELRKKLIKYDLIEAIISLPSGTLPYTGIAPVIMVLNMNKPEAKRGFTDFIHIQFPDETSASSKRRQILLDLYKNASKDKHRSVSNIIIAQNDYILLPNRYLQDELDKDLVQLKELIAPYSPSQTPEQDNDGTIPYLTIGGLRKKTEDFILTRTDIKGQSSSRSGLVISEDALLINLQGDKLYPTLFDSKHGSVLVSPSIGIFHINVEQVNPTYLIQQIRSNSVQQQLDSLKRGSTVPFITKTDLLHIKISLPEFDEQERLAQVYSETLGVTKTYIQEVKTSQAEDFATLYNNISSLKHAIGSQRQNILSWSKTLISFFQQNNDLLHEIDEKFKKRFHISIMEVLSQIRGDIDSISLLLEYSEEGFSPKNFPKSTFFATEVIQSIQEGIQHYPNYRIKLVVPETPELEGIGLHTNPTLMLQMMNIILHNASKHAFEGPEVSNLVLLEFRIQNNQFIMEIKNNGKPLPRNYTQESFVQLRVKGEGSDGTGIGGHDIDRFARYLDSPDWQLRTEDPIYPVSFYFNFPITPIS